MICATPLEVTDAVLVSSTAVDESLAAWSGGMSYAVGARVVRPNHHIYENLIAGVSAVLPEVACYGTGPAWSDVGMVNRWRMFDSKSRTQTEFAGGLGTVVLQYTGIPTQLSLVNLIGRSVSVTMEADGAVVFSVVIGLDGTIISTFWQYMTAQFVQRKNVVVTLPPYYNPKITVSITGEGVVKCGVCQAGMSREIGRAQKGLGLAVKNFGTLSFSDVTGDVTDYVPRWNKKTESFVVLILNADLEGFLQTIDSLLSVYCMWVPSDDDRYQFFSLYGVCSSYDLVVKSATHSTYNLVIKEL